MLYDIKYLSFFNKNMKKNVLITGITGMVGSHLTDYLLKKTNWKIYGLCRWRSPLDNVSHILSLANQKRPRIQFINADLNDYSSLIKALEISIIFVLNLLILVPCSLYGENIALL